MCYLINIKIVVCFKYRGSRDEGGSDFGVGGSGEDVREVFLEGYLVWVLKIELRIY